MKQIDRLFFLQGQRCFFCQQSISPGQASVEHIVAQSNGGPNDDENCVVCCKTINGMLGNLSVKEKLKAVLNHGAGFACPATWTLAPTLGLASPANDEPDQINEPDERLSLVIEDLIRQGAKRPKRVGALKNTISNLFKNRVCKDDIKGLVLQLQVLGYVSIKEDTVSYSLPARRFG